MSHVGNSRDVRLGRVWRFVQLSAAWVVPSITPLGVLFGEALQRRLRRQVVELLPFDFGEESVVLDLLVTLSRHGSYIGPQALFGVSPQQLRYQVLGLIGHGDGVTRGVLQDQVLYFHEVALRVLEGSVAVDHLVDQDAECPEVDLERVAHFGDDFGCEVLRRARNLG